MLGRNCPVHGQAHPAPCAMGCLHHDVHLSAPKPRVEGVHILQPAPSASRRAKQPWNASQRHHTEGRSMVACCSSAGCTSPPDCFAPCCQQGSEGSSSVQACTVWAGHMHRVYPPEQPHLQLSPAHPWVLNFNCSKLLESGSRQTTVASGHSILNRTVEKPTLAPAQRELGIWVQPERDCCMGGLKCTAATVQLAARSARHRWLGKGRPILAAPCLQHTFDPQQIKSTQPIPQPSTHAHLHPGCSAAAVCPQTASRSSACNGTGTPAAQ